MKSVNMLKNMAESQKKQVCRYYFVGMMAVLTLNTAHADSVLEATTEAFEQVQTAPEYICSKTTVDDKFACESYLKKTIGLVIKLQELDLNCQIRQSKNETMSDDEMKACQNLRAGMSYFHGWGG